MNASIARRSLVAVCLVGAVLGSVAGQAAEATAAPLLISTSVDNGFSSLNPIAARFNVTLNPTLSVGALRDKDGKEVLSTVTRTSSGQGPDGDSLMLTPQYTTLRETLSPYTVSFTAFAQTAGSPGTGAAVTKIFTYDLERPEVAITSPQSSGPVGVLAPGEKLVLAGYAYDRLTYDNVFDEATARTANRSGLKRVEIQFYKLNPAVRGNPSVTPGRAPNPTNDPPDPGTPPTVTLPTVQPSQEVAALRHDAPLVDCTRGAACVDGEKAWTANTAGLTPGSWTARAISVDVAGNRSMISETSFIVT